MGITIKELLQMKEFSRYQVLCGGHGLNRTVSSVSVMDAPDIYRWLDGGEVLLTSGYILQSHLN